MDRRAKIGLIAAAVVLLLALGYVYYRNNSSGLGGEENVSNEALRILSPGSRAELEDDLARLQEREQDSPESPEEQYGIYLRLAQLKYDLGRNRDAMADLEKIADDTREYADPGRVWYLYANIYNDSQDVDRALESIKRAVEADPDEEDYWLAYVGFTLQKDPNADVNNLYTEALQKTNNNLDMIVAYARYLEFKSQKDQAIAQWQKAIEINPDDRAVYEAEIQRLQAP